MRLQSGTRIGPYEVVERLGAGGMGEVYRARDAKLQRDVAIKILPDGTLDADRLARFEREARVLAALNHPNIGAIYGFEQNGEVHGLVLELVEGPTLADRLQSGPIPLGEALRIARDIADALDAAHSKGIVHRDLKPANIKVATSGAVKVLDFGLAKIDERGDPGGDLSHSPTITVAGTRDGVILGTAGYMSPEQARGKPLDKRTDIWSFGCVLYEMLTGRQAFAGETVSDSIAAILGREPEWALLDDTLPPQVRRLLARCLEKDANERLRDIGDARQELDHVLADRREGGVAPPVVGARRFTRPVGWRGAAVAVALAIAAGGAIVLLRRPAPVSSPLQPPVQLTFFNDSAVQPSLSPDGRMVTFSRGGWFSGSAPRGQIYVKILPTGDPVQLTRDSSGKAQPVFSPDGSRIIYTAVQSFKWDSWQVPVLGGAPQPFLPNASGLIWLDDRQLLYSEIMGSGAHMGIVTSTQSRDGARAVYFPRGEAGMAHRSSRSPDGKSVLVAEMNSSEWLPCRLVPFDGSAPGHAVGPLDGGCTTAAWSPDGAWMYFSSNSGGRFHIWRQRYPDGRRADHLRSDRAGGYGYHARGRYLITGMGLQSADIVLRGTPGDQPLTSEGFAMLPTMMPGGERMFYLTRQGSRGFVTGELWSMIPATGERTRVLPGHLMANYSISPDGRRVVFAGAGGEAGTGIWIADLDRRTPPRQIARGQESRAFFGAPGEVVYFEGSQGRLYRINDDGTDARALATDTIYQLLTVSPDGRWAVVLAPESGGTTKTEFVSLTGEPTVSVCCPNGFGAGNRVQALPYNWSPDGKSLFVALQYFPLGTPRTVVLPYRSGVPFDVQWPRGFKSEDDVVANPGARVINETNVFPASKPGEYLRWTRSTQSNLYQIALPK